MRCEGATLRARAEHESTPLRSFFSNPLRLYSIVITTNSRQNGGSVDRPTKALFWVIRFVKLCYRPRCYTSGFSFLYISGLSYYVKMMQQLGHFRVTLCLCIKTSLRAKPFLWKWTGRWKTVSYGWFLTKTSFVSESKANSEMAFSVITILM